MYVPPASLPAAPLAPAALEASASSTEGATRPAHTELTVHARELNVLSGTRASVTGALLEGGRQVAAGLAVELEGLHGRDWHVLARARTNARGDFRLSYVPHTTLSEPVRVSFAGDATATRARRALGRLNVYRPVIASWYGGGGELACGGELTSETLGVASRTLPCGTLVTLRYGGRTVRVPVVDRGPYVEGRELDLTEATKEALGFGGVGTVWSTA